ncbi:MAG: tetratricopeptide repeat protein [Phormidesmis sp.]
MQLPLKSVYRQQAAKLAYRRALAYEQQQSYPQAIDAFTQAIAKGYARSFEALVRRGVNRVKVNDLEGAIADFESVIQSDASPDTSADISSNLPLAQAYYQRGLLRQQRGDSLGALADWSDAIAQHPKYPQPYAQRALMLLAQGEHERALADLNSAIAANPTFASAYLQRGNLRHQLGDVLGAIADWEYAICNDFTLESAKQKIEAVHRDAYDARLTQVLAAPLTAKGLSVSVQHSSHQLDIHIHREVGTGVSYYTLPDLIREHLVPLHIAEVHRFRLIGRVGKVNRPDWEQTYDLYKGQPCPPSNWQVAFSTIFLFPPFAIPAFVQAAQVKQAYNKGQYVEALRASKAVKGLCVASSVALGFFTLLPLGYAAYDSMKETPTFKVSEEIEQTTNRPYHEIWKN